MYTLSKLHIVVSSCPRSPDPETVALHEDCVHVLLSLTCSPPGLHLLVSSGGPQTAARALVAGGGGGGGASIKQLLVHLLGHPAVVARHREVVEEVVSLLAAEFRDNQVHNALCDCSSVLYI